MKYFKKGTSVYITELKFQELLAFLKIQLPAELMFSLSNKLDPSKTIDIGERYHEREQKIVCGLSAVNDSYENLVKSIGILQQTHQLIVKCELNDFRRVEPLVKLIEKIRPDVVKNCVSLDILDLSNNNIVYKITYLPFPNGDSNYLLYYDSNQTLLGFYEDGPVMMTENEKINNITDIIC